jgi:hypothetical protein
MGCQPEVQEISPADHDLIRKTKILRIVTDSETGKED